MFLESLCLPRACFWTPLSSAGMFLHVLCLPRACLWTAFTLSSTMGLFLDPFFGLPGGPFWGSILVPVVRFGAPFWRQWCVLGFPFGWLSWHHPPDPANTMPKSLKRPSHERAALSWSSSLFLGSLLLGKSRRSALQSAKRVQAACTIAKANWKCSSSNQNQRSNKRKRALKGKALSEALHYLDFGRPNARHHDLPEIQEFLIRRFQIMMWWRWSVLVPVVRFGPLFSRWSSVLGFHFGDSIFGAPFWWWSVFGAPFWCRWSVLGLHFGVLGLHFGASGPFWGSILVPVVRFGAPFWGSILVPVVRFGAPLWHRWSVFGAPLWCRWSVLGLGFGSVVRFWGSVLVPLVGFGAPFWCRWSVRVVRFWGSILVPVVRFGARFWFRWSVFGAPFWCRWSVFGARFWCRWSVLGLQFGAGGPFWGSILVPVVRFRAPFWVPVVRSGARFVLGPVVLFGARFWCRWSVLGLHCGAGGPFLGLGFGTGGPFWGSILVPVVRFGASVWWCWSVFGAPFWCGWFVLGLDFVAGGPFWGSIVVPVVRFWGSIVVRVVRFGAPFWFGGSFLGLGFGAAGRFWGSILVPVVRFGAPFWCRWSVLGLHCGTGDPFLGLHFGAGGLFWGSVLVPVVRFWGSILVPVVRFWGSVLVPLVGFGAPFWYRWSVLGLGGSFSGSILVPVVRSGARFWCRCSILGLDFGPGSFWGSFLGGWSFLGLDFGAGGPFLGLGFGTGGPFWGSILVPVVRFGASVWWCWSVFGAPFWCGWFALGLDFVAGGPCWGSIVVPVVRFLGLDCGTGGPFWGSVLVPVVRFEAPFWLVFRYSGLVRFGDPFWGSILVPVVRFGFGPALASGGSFLNLRWLPGARFWAPKFVPGPSRPTISESPYICVKSSNHPLFASLAFVFPFAPPSFWWLPHKPAYDILCYSYSRWALQSCADLPSAYSWWRTHLHPHCTLWPQGISWLRIGQCSGNCVDGVWKHRCRYWLSATIFFGKYMGETVVTLNKKRDLCICMNCSKIIIWNRFGLHWFNVWNRGLWHCSYLPSPWRSQAGLVETFGKGNHPSSQTTNGLLVADV